MGTMVPRDGIVGLMIGPTIWLTYFVLSYLISGIGCRLGYQHYDLVGTNPIHFLVLVAGVVAAALIAIAGMHAYRGRSRALSSTNASDRKTTARNAFLYGVALVLSTLSLVGVLWLAMNAMLTPVC